MDEEERIHLDNVYGYTEDRLNSIFSFCKKASFISLSIVLLSSTFGFIFPHHLLNFFGCCTSLCITVRILYLNRVTNKIYENRFAFYNKKLLKNKVPMKYRIT